MRQRPFSELIRNRRRELRLTQQALARASAIPQATISAWEKGKQLPHSAAVERLSSLASALNVSEALVAAALQEQVRAPVLSLALSDDAYLSYQQNFLDECLREVSTGSSAQHPTAVWLLGPETLPIQRSPRFGEIWVENLRRGIHYNIVWLLCLIRPGRLGQLATVLREVGERIDAGAQNAEEAKANGTGKIHHYGCVLFGDPPRKENLDLNLEDFNALGANAPVGNLFYPPKGGKPLPDDDRERLASYCARFASIIVCKPGSPSRSPLASINLPKVRSSPEGTSVSVWHFFDRDDAIELTTLVTSLERTVRGGYATLPKE